MPLRKRESGPSRGRARESAVEECRDDRRRHRARPAVRRPLPRARAPGRRRHGDRLPGRGLEPRPQGRAQGHGRALRRGRRVRRALPARGAGRRAPQPPEHHRGLRPRRGRRPALHRHGVPAGPHAQAGHPGARAPLPPERAIAIAMQVLAGPALRPRARRRPPRRQAAQRARRRRRAHQGDRFRHRPRGRSADDRGRLDRRHCPVPLARAGARPQRRPADRHLLARRRALRDARRPRAVRGRLVGRDRDAARLRQAAAAALARARTCPSRSRSSSPTRCSRIRRSATAAPTSSQPTSTACAAGSCPSLRPPLTGDRPARADRARARRRGDAHRAAPGAHAAAQRREAAPAAHAAQALALAMAARAAPAARGRGAGGVRDRRRARRRRLDDERARRIRGPLDRRCVAQARRPQGKTCPRRWASCTAISSSSTSRRRSTCATPRTQPTSWSGAIRDPGVVLHAATRCASRSRAGRRRSRTSSARRRPTRSRRSGRTSSSRSLGGQRFRRQGQGHPHGPGRRHESRWAPR